MASVIISYKILPTSLEVDFNKLQKQIESILPSNAKVYADYQTEPIAFGLNALIAHIQIPEEQTGVLSQLEENLESLPEISRIQTLMVRRAR